MTVILKIILFLTTIQLSVAMAPSLYSQNFINLHMATATTPMENAIRSEISTKIISSKAHVCPFAVRLSWHTSGTYDKDDTTSQAGGSNGATMRFPPEIDDEANAGLSMMQNILEPVKRKYPKLSYSDLWTLAGVQAIKLMGGPDVPFNFGRTDKADGATCPMHGRLPDAAQGADHLRDVFYRMGFDDKDIVALSGAHTVGSCHETRSGFDGPWTSNPTKFDNEYFRNLLKNDWTIRKWEGPEQFTDPTGKLMMLPTDMALIEDEQFLQIVKNYAVNEKQFFNDFAVAFGKLISLGCPAHCQPGVPAKNLVEESKEDSDFRDMTMHGNLIRMKEIPGKPNPNSKEHFTDRTPLHKASYFGYSHVIEYLLECGANVNVDDVEGDTPLHDACRLGHVTSVKLLLKAGAITDAINKLGESPADLAKYIDCEEISEMLSSDGGSNFVRKVKSMDKTEN